MSHLRNSLFVIAVLFVGAHSMLAGTYVVGRCEPNLPSYNSISAAVSAVPSGSIVEVCPNTYAEQITISQPLTLKGIVSAGTSDVVITVPGGGLTQTSSVIGSPVYAQIAVAANPVNISNITVDGSNSGISCSEYLVGIFYGDGASGTVSTSTLRHQTTGCGSGVGIFANTFSSSESLTVKNSTFHDIDNSAVFTYGYFSGTITGNFIVGSSGGIGIFLLGNGGGSITGNSITGGYQGINVNSCCTVTISGNNISNSNIGLVTPNGSGGTLTATSNKIWSVTTGIYLGEGGDTFKSNTIANTGTAIEFNCHSAVATSNTINDATTGFDQVPASFSGGNSFSSVVAIRTGGC